MEKLWSPWRSKYIDSFKFKTGKEECVFCAAANQDIHNDESLVVIKGQYTFLILNLYPYNGGHLMVCPNRHICDIKELNESEFTETYQFIQKTVKVLENIMKPHGFNIGLNVGKAAGAGIDEHLHFHILPRWTGDTNFMPAIGEVKVISQDLLDMKHRLQTEFKNIG